MHLKNDNYLGDCPNCKWEIAVKRDLEGKTRCSDCDAEVHPDKGFVGREVLVHGVVELPKDMTPDQFDNLFLQFLDVNGLSFGGGTRELTEDDE